MAKFGEIEGNIGKLGESGKIQEKVEGNWGKLETILRRWKCLGLLSSSLQHFFTFKLPRFTF